MTPAWMTLVACAALFVGATLAILGAGGSVLTMPLLVYGVGLDAQAAAGTSLLVVGVVATVSAVVRRRDAAISTALLFALTGIPGAIVGAWLNSRTPGRVVLVALALLLLLAAWRLLRADRGLAAVPPRRSKGLAASCGLALGAATGFFGVGGGFLVVPALRSCLGVPMHAAVATSLSVIALNSAGGLLAHAVLGGVHWRLGLFIGGAALVGAVVAAPFASRVDDRVASRLFATVLVVVAIGMLTQVAGVS